MKTTGRLTLTALLLLVGACTSTPSAPRYEPISFAAEGAIPLAVARVVVEQRYRSPLQPPHVEHDFPVRPAEALEVWAHERLQAVGPAGEALFVIDEASAVETKLKKEGGIKGAFTTDQDARYTVKLRAHIDIANNGGLQKGQISAEAERSKTLPEDVSLNQRDRFYYDLTKEAMTELDKTLQREILAHLSGFVGK